MAEKNGNLPLRTYHDRRELADQIRRELADRIPLTLATHSGSRFPLQDWEIARPDEQTDGRVEGALTRTRSAAIGAPKWF